MKAKPLRRIEVGYEPCEASDATHVELHTVGPFPSRIIPIQTKGRREGTGNWTWNGDTEKPTLRPSILTTLPRGDDPEVRCHSWVTDGQMIFLGDSTHSYSGQTVDLLDVE